MRVRCRRRCCCGRLVRQHVGFTASLANKYSDVRTAESAGGPAPELEEWSVEKHTEASPTDAYGVVNFQGGSHSYRAKVGSMLLFCRSFFICDSYEARIVGREIVTQKKQKSPLSSKHHIKFTNHPVIKLTSDCSRKLQYSNNIY